MKRIITTVLFALIYIGAEGQGTAHKFIFALLITSEGKDLFGADVKILKDGKEYKHYVYDSSLNFYAKNSKDYELNSDYLFIITKGNYISEKIEINTHIPVGKDTINFPAIVSRIELNKQATDTVIEYLDVKSKWWFDNLKNEFVVQYAGEKRKFKIISKK